MSFWEGEAPGEPPSACGGRASPWGSSPRSRLSGPVRCRDLAAQAGASPSAHGGRGDVVPDGQAVRGMGSTYRRPRGALRLHAPRRQGAAEKRLPMQCRCDKAYRIGTKELTSTMQGRQQRPRRTEAGGPDRWIAPERRARALRELAASGGRAALFGRPHRGMAPVCGESALPLHRAVRPMRLGLLVTPPHSAPKPGW